MSRASWVEVVRPWLLALPVGVLVGLLVAGATQELQERREVTDQERRAATLRPVDEVGPPGDTVRALVEQDVSVPIHPELAARIEPEDVARARAVLEATGRPLHLGHLPAPVGIYAGYNAEAAIAQWAHSVGEDGHYVLLLDSGRAVIESRGLKGAHLSASAKGQPGPALVRIAEEMATWSLEPVPPLAQDSEWSDEWGGTSGGVGLGLMAACFIVVPAFFVLRLLVGRKRPVRK